MDIVKLITSTLLCPKQDIFGYSPHAYFRIIYIKVIILYLHKIIINLCKSKSVFPYIEERKLHK